MQGASSTRPLIYSELHAETFASPHSEADVAAMLKAIGASQIEELFDEIPAALKLDELKAVPSGLSEMEVTRLMRSAPRRTARC